MLLLELRSVFLVCWLLRQMLQSLVSHPFSSLATLSQSLENNMPLPSVLCAFSFSRCCQAQRLISVLIWNNSRALHEAISLFPPQGVVAGRRLRAIVLPPCVPPAAAANIVPFYLLPPLCKPAGLAAEGCSSH